jgi:hypothetical protein
LLFILLFWAAAIFWDSMIYLVSAHPVPRTLRCYRRTSRCLTLRGFHAYFYQQGGSLPSSPCCLSYTRLVLTLFKKHVHVLSHLHPG